MSYNTQETSEIRVSSKIDQFPIFFKGCFDFLARCPKSSSFENSWFLFSIYAKSTNDSKNKQIAMAFSPIGIKGYVLSLHSLNYACRQCNERTFDNRRVK